MDQETFDVLVVGSIGIIVLLVYGCCELLLQRNKKKYTQATRRWY